MFKTIVAPFDGSDPAKHALEKACEFAKTFGAELHLVHTPQIDTTMVAVGYSVVELPLTQEIIDDAGKKIMDAAVKQVEEAGLTPASTTTMAGDPAETILHVAKLNDADLIVMGRRGLGSVASLFLGSVSQKVGHGATCSVLTVH
ncbi:universal stress protein [Rhodobacterales bacterium HKCCE4037]|nr:universal stress protein [Rhodobacterales bacterium HKCCE4037]